MNALSVFYSAMAVVFILLISLATLEAQRNEKDKFFDLMATIGEHFRGEFNDAEKVLELDLNGANAFLKELHTFATCEIVTKNENGQFECKESKKPDFIKAIKEILGENSDKEVRNLLKAIIVPKPIKTIFGKKSYKKVEDLVNELSVKFSEEQLFHLLFSLAARLEALVTCNKFRVQPTEGYRSKVFWRGMEEYYLSIQLMQLTEQARTLGKTFGKMLENVKEHHAQ